MNLLFVILSIPGFLKTIGIIVLVYYGLKFIGRLLFPIVIKKAVNNMQARQYAHTARKAEGEVTIERKPGQQKNQQHTQGEYVDFEEVD